ncbi:MAG TPA: hypothetical protein VJ123_11105 [Anaerolineales bacterium]|nr:hypothetical protein [Anaerolineales bacterium]
MRIWSLGLGSPLSLCLSADARFSTPSYVDDQSWELTLGGGDPPGVAISTTYGLRSHGMRIFPGFGLDGSMVTDPGQFASPPVLQRFFPDYLCVAMSPFPQVEVLAEFWAPSSHGVVGRFTLGNTSDESQQLRLRLYAVLRSADLSQSMSEAIEKGIVFLSGRTGVLAPVVFLAGGATAERVPFPALAVSATLLPGTKKSLHWAHVGLPDLDAGFELARSLAARTWEAEIARLELANAAQIDIETGDPDWDAVLAMSQKAALASFLGPTSYLPHPSFVFARAPDRGYSERGDGRDYDRQWDGQTAAHAYFLCPQIIHAAPVLAKGVLRNFLAVQAADGSIDSKPGLGGQRGRALSLPLLASLAWRIYQSTEDLAFLEEVFDRLREFFEAWFTAEHDRDQDGHPEWDHTLQAAFDDWPAFVRWRRWGQALDLRAAETPDLASYLYREARTLVAMAHRVGQPESVAQLLARAEKLRTSVERTWRDETASYHHQDRDLHRAAHGEFLGKGRGEFTLDLERTFDPPVRVLVRICGPEGQSRAAQVFIHGRGRRGRPRVEKLSAREFQWFWDCGTSTSEKVYAEIERVEVRGVSEAFETEVATGDFTRQDITTLLPLWAGIPNEERAGRMVRQTILDPQRYWRPLGLPRSPASDPVYDASLGEGCGGVDIYWNTLIGEGLLDYGYREEAAELLRRLMASVSHALREGASFREAYHPDRPESVGERNHLAGVFPVHLFLEALGVRLVTPRKLWLFGRNPFPWPVVIRWRGLEVIRPLDEPTKVSFPDGQSVVVEGEGLQEIEQSDAHQRTA